MSEWTVLAKRTAGVRAPKPVVFWLNKGRAVVGVGPAYAQAMSVAVGDRVEVSISSCGSYLRLRRTDDTSVGRKLGCRGKYLCLSLPPCNCSDGKHVLASSECADGALTLRFEVRAAHETQAQTEA